MSSEKELRDLPYAAASGVVIAVAPIGLADVLANGSGLDAASAAATVLLWMTFAAPAAGMAGIAAILIARLHPSLPASRFLAVVISVALLLIASTALGARLVGTPLAAALGLLALALPALLRRVPQWMGKAPILAVAAAILTPGLAAGLGALRSQEPALPPLSSVQATTSGTGAARPHVVLIVLDTLRADHLGAYGHTGGLSPAFDALAAEGTLFDRCYAPASWTVPSHASLFTGLYPATHGTSFAQHRWLDDDFTTLAESLHERGYRTAAFSANLHVRLANLAQGFELYRPIGDAFSRLAIRKPLSMLGWPERWIDDGAANGVDEIERFLEDEVPRLDDSPLFLFVNLIEPHWRYLPPLEERRHAIPSGASYLGATRAAATFYGPLAMADGNAVPDAQREAIRHFYAAEVRYQDSWLRRLVAAIDASLGAENTLIVITADHGENLGEGGRWDHVFALNDHLIRVPMLLRRPGHVPVERRSELCQLTDVPATVARAAGGLTLDPRQAGRDLLDPRESPRPVAFAEGDPYYGHLERMSHRAGYERDVGRFTASLTAAHDGRFKYVESSRAEPVLYDLAGDPDELEDVRHAHPEIAHALAAALSAWRERTTRYALPEGSTTRHLDGDDRARLESLGYVQ